jgi:hypothetical protein
MCLAGRAAAAQAPGKKIRVPLSPVSPDVTLNRKKTKMSINGLPANGFDHERGKYNIPSNGTVK